MKTLRSKICNLLATCLLLVIPSAVVAADADDDTRLMVDNLDSELRNPVIEKRQQTYVRTYMKNIAESLYRQGFDVETMRSGEVVIVVMPTDEIFYPNEATIMAGAHKRLNQFLQFSTSDNRYKIILAVHSDNTGSDQYLHSLTLNRVNALIDYFESGKADVETIVGFPMADTEPLSDNFSRAGRAANRRLEIYIVPDEGLIKLAKASR